MKRLLFIAALAALVWFSHEARKWSEQLFSNGVETGSAVGEIQQTFARREIERKHEVESAVQAAQQRIQQEQADRAAHEAVWDEIKRQRRLEDNH